MKISNEQLRALQEAELQKSRQEKQSGAVSGNFADLLTKHLQPEAAQESATQGLQGALTQGLSMPLDIAQVDSAAADTLVADQEAAARMDGMFTGIERYAEQIARGDRGNLREAYGHLQSVSEQIAGFKADYPNAGEDMPELASMLNELDVLTTTETFKFNRGDYL